MGDDEPAEGTSARVARVVREHGPLLGRVCMALVGEHGAVERALEQVARDAATKPLPADDAGMKVFLLGLARSACAIQSSRLPVRRDEAPTTERMHGDEAAKARASVGALKPTEREAVVLHLVGGLGVDEIAIACNIAKDAARSRLSRGIAQLRGGKQ